MAIAKCLRIEYEAGERIVCQGVKGHRAGKHVGGHFFQNAGYGVGQYFISSKLLLYVQLSDAKEYTLRVDRLFKEKVGKLTEQRRELISRTMPEEIKIRKVKKKFLCSDPEMSLDERTLQYEPLRKELQDWLARLHELMTNQKEIRKISKGLKQKKEEKRSTEKEAERKQFEYFEQLSEQWEREQAEEEALLEERRKNALKLAFVKGWNPKYGNEQWEARHNGRFYVLRREDTYEPSEGQIPVEAVFDLVPDRIVLVARI